MVTIGFGGKTKPQVAYATALDVFIIICSVLVFFALAEFALLSFLDVYIRRYKEKEEAKEKQDKVDYIKHANKFIDCVPILNIRKGYGGGLTPILSVRPCQGVRKAI